MKFNPESDHWHWYERKCPSCPPEKGWQDLSAFYKCAARPNGVTSRCRVCCRRDVIAQRASQSERMLSRIMASLNQPKTAVEISLDINLSAKVIAGRLRSPRRKGMVIAKRVRTADGVALLYRLAA